MDIFFGSGKNFSGPGEARSTRTLVTIADDRIVSLGILEHHRRGEKVRSIYEKGDLSSRLVVSHKTGRIFLEKTDESLGRFERFGDTDGFRVSHGNDVFQVERLDYEHFSIEHNGTALGTGDTGSHFRRQMFFSNYVVGGRKFRGKPFLVDLSPNLMETPLFLACLSVIYSTVPSCVDHQVV